MKISVSVVYEVHEKKKVWMKFLSHKSSSNATWFECTWKHTSLEATDDDICGSLGSHNRVSRSASDLGLANNNSGSNQRHIAVNMHTKITAKYD
jgi:hypothetical protein